MDDPIYAYLEIVVDHNLMIRKPECETPFSSLTFAQCFQCLWVYIFVRSCVAHC